MEKVLQKPSMRKPGKIGNEEEESSAYLLKCQTQELGCVVVELLEYSLSPTLAPTLYIDSVP